MNDATRTVAVLTDNPALSEILSSVLSHRQELRVRSFESVHALRTYFRVARVDLLVCDFDVAGDTADRFIPDLRELPGNDNPLFRVIALTRTISPQTRGMCAAAGIEEIIVKPMSPRYVEERVIARLRQPTRALARRNAGLAAALSVARRAAGQASPEALGDNVVRLIPRNPSPARMG